MIMQTHYKLNYESLRLLLQPGKPVFISGSSSKRWSMAYKLSCHTSNILSHREERCLSEQLKPSHFKTLKKAPVKTLLFFSGLHAVNGAITKPELEAIIRMISFFMRNKKRLILLTGETFNFPPIINRVAHHIIYN